jgi:hypothetical protein
MCPNIPSYITIAISPFSEPYQDATTTETTGCSTSIEISIGAISEDAFKSSQRRIVKTSMWLRRIQKKSETLDLD